MKIVFDCRFIRMDHHDGISRFSSELFTALASLVPVTALICDRRQLDRLPAGSEFLMGNDPTNGIGEIFIARTLNKFGATHVFSPMQTMGSTGRRYKLILTLHDLIYYSHPKAPPSLPLLVRIAWRIYHLNYLGARLLLNRADVVATVSNTSKELIQKHKLTKRKVVVIYNAPDSSGIHAQIQVAGSGKNSKTLVYMGSFMDYKNVECLVEGLKDLPEFRLVLLSKISKERRRQLLQAAGSAANRIEFKNGVSEQEYAEILANAFALVSASKEEGFGIPLVEAMTHGLPIVVSDIPIFREVAADAAYYFDPTNPSDFSRQVKLLDEMNNWIELSSKSNRRSKVFNWTQSAKTLLETLEAI